MRTKNLSVIGTNTYRSYSLELDVQACHRHFRYSADIALRNCESLTVSIMPIYRSGTTSLTSDTGSARIEVVKNNPFDSWKLYELVYTNVVTSKTDLGRAVLCELDVALCRAGVLPEGHSINITFKQENILRSISA
jgi:hypothetical protein